MVPKRLQDWTYDRIEELTNENEGEIHDFKSSIPDSKELTKDCCAFANSKGGFIILGVVEHRRTFRIEGIKKNKDLANKFGKGIHSSPRIHFKGPKIIDIPDSAKVLAVFNIPLSPIRPHIPTTVDQRVFYKRSNTGNEQMTYEEIKDVFRESLTKKNRTDLSEIKFRILFTFYQRYYKTRDSFLTKDVIMASNLAYFDRELVLGEIAYLQDSKLVKEKDPLEFLGPSLFGSLNKNVPVGLIITSKGIDAMKKSINELIEFFKEFSEDDYKQIDTITDFKIKLREIWRVLNQNNQLRKLFFDKN